MTRINPPPPVPALQSPVWRPGDNAPAVPESPDKVYREDILAAIENSLKGLDGELRALSIDIHDHPELGFEEHRTHDVLTAFMERHGFEVTRHYYLETAWRAAFSSGKGGRTVGVNSEMDALPGIGHGCGHNLIAISGVAVACAIKAVFEQFGINGTVVLLGTPAEEGGNGKVELLDRGAYQDMAVCLMTHPAPGPKASVSLSSCLALERLEVEYFGHTAHAGLSPWEGRNALDAAVLGYNNISALRQQLKPTHRVHGIFEGKKWAPNVIPDYAKFICYVRAPTLVEMKETLTRVLRCFEAAALASECTHKVVLIGTANDLRQNKALGDEITHIIRSKYGSIDYEWGIKNASTDFGNISYALPSLHPGYAIPTVPDGGNHTVAFTNAAATIEAHYACLDVSKALAAVGVRVVIDDHFYAEVQKTFEEDKIARLL